MEQKRIEIRRYEPADNACLTAIWYQASCISHPFLPDSLLQEQRLQISSKYLPETETWVAVGPAGPVGFIGLIDLFIGGLFIAPEWQSRGIGSLLLSHAFDLKGKLALEVYVANQRAVDFYRKHGFCGVRRRETDDNGLPYPLILMQKPCPSASRRTPTSSSRSF
ncbi:GNAT family N-acetyltransferase [Martelella mediterranea]|uniref:Putative acetyltransferase n=1 Tax=Martelella mediterranea TaxID=293089 RepID=A0A4R3NQH9_9HYPH|nr:GNAT family N-acetyltransferase [Martelella mediterranea]TCT37327.1 putative acetyltransferase [Martelella mediterranea]